MTFFLYRTFFFPTNFQQKTLTFNKNVVKKRLVSIRINKNSFSKFRKKNDSFKANRSA